MYGISPSTFHGWKGSVIVRRNLLKILPAEEQSVVKFRRTHPDIGYRKLAHLMNDEKVAALSESAVYAVLSKNNLTGYWNKPVNKNTAKEYYHKPKKVHEHWHTDLAYVKINGVFYFLIIMLDGYSRYVLDWDLLPDMLSSSVQEFILRVRESYPNCSPKLIHDNGSCFISKDFKMLVSNLGIQQIFTRRNHPQTNGKIERLNGTIRQEALRKHYPSSFLTACSVIKNFVHSYNNKRLHAGIKYLRPVDLFLGRDHIILNNRKIRIQNARINRIQQNKISYQNQQKVSYLQS